MTMNDDLEADLGQHFRIVAPNLRPIIAEPLVEGLLVDSAPEGMYPIPEGPAVDRDGTLLFVSAFPDADGVNVFRFRPDTDIIEPVLSSPESGFASLVIHQDGRLFLCDFFNGIDGGGRIAVAESDGTGLRTLIDNFEGTRIVPDDLVFARSGAFYYNDFQGTALEPTGRVIRVTPDGTQSLMLSGFAHPNGIALNEAEDRIWISDHLTNRLFSAQLHDDGTLGDSRIDGYFTGGLLDSTTLDSAGNIYQAVYDGGRVEVLDPDANPLAVIVPGTKPRRDYIRTTHVAIEPGGRKGYLVAGGPHGAGIFGFTAFANGLTPISHR